MNAEQISVHPPNSLATAARKFLDTLPCLTVQFNGEQIVAQRRLIDALRDLKQ